MHQDAFEDKARKRLLAVLRAEEVGVRSQLILTQTQFQVLFGTICNNRDLVQNLKDRFFDAWPLFQAESSPSPSLEQDQRDFRELTRVFEDAAKKFMKDSNPKVLEEKLADVGEEVEMLSRGMATRPDPALESQRPTMNDITALIQEVAQREDAAPSGRHAGSDGPLVMAEAVLNKPQPVKRKAEDLASGAPFKKRLKKQWAEIDQLEMLLKRQITRAREEPDPRLHDQIALLTEQLVRSRKDENDIREQANKAVNSYQKRAGKKTRRA
jgi:hypothetical protein